MIAATWDWVPYDYCNFEALMCSNRMRNFFKSRDRLRVFAADRNWDQFHNPKNLAMALVVEAGELVEPFQWLTEEQSLRLDSKQRCHVQNEVADVFIYLIRLADKLGIDSIDSANKKIDLNNERYPVSEAYGSAVKTKHK